MFGFKRKGREQSAKFHSTLKGFLMPMLNNLFIKTRYRGRARLINRWGRKHPKKVIWLYSASAVLLLGLNLPGLFIPQNNNPGRDPLRLEDMAKTGSVFDGMTDINRNREAIQSAVSDYAKVNVELCLRLDSLISLENKTATDSLEIMQLYRKLNYNTN